MPLLAEGLHDSCHTLILCHCIHMLPPTSSILFCNLLFGLTLFPSLGVQSIVFLAHMMLLIQARYFAHCPLIFLTISMMFFTSVLDIMTSFLTVSLLVMFSMAPSMLFWATASFLSCYFVRTYVSAPYVLAGKMTSPMAHWYFPFFQKVAIYSTPNIQVKGLDTLTHFWLCPNFWLVLYLAPTNLHTVMSCFVIDTEQCPYFWRGRELSRHVLNPFGNACCYITTVVPVEGCVWTAVCEGPCVVHCVQNVHACMPKQNS